MTQSPSLQIPTSAVRRFAVPFLAVLLATLLAAVTLAPADADAKKPRKGPKGAKFYKPPKNMPKGHGKLIWQRKATKLAPIAGAKWNRTVLYTSKSPQGKRIAVSGSVSVPKGKPPKGGWPLISYAHGTTGTADSCAPSRAGTKSMVAPYIDYVDPELQAWIKAGYAIARTDFQGLGTPGPHPYLVGVSEGRGVLDIARAARQLNRGVGKRFLIAGHSQGGQSALFAGSLAEKWTPDLKLRGVVSYAPASHMKEQANLLPALKQPSSLSALASLIFEGAATTSDAIVVSDILTPEAQALYPQIKTKCLPELAEPDSFGGLAPAKLLAPGADLDPLYQALENMNPAVKINSPILLAQGLSDTTVFPAFTDLLNGQLVQLQDSVNYITFPGVTHSEVVGAAEGDAMAFFKKRLPPK